MINVTKREYDFLEETKHKADVMGFSDLWCYKQIIQFVQRECDVSSQLDPECYAYYMFEAYHKGYETIQLYYFKVPNFKSFWLYNADCDPVDGLYLNRSKDVGSYELFGNSEDECYQTKFTADEIKEFKDKYSKYFNFDSWEMIPVDD